MVTLTILCEGATEKNFVVLTLAPHLKNFNVFAKPVNLGGTQNLKGLHIQINSSLRSRRDHEYITTMLDLYGLGKLPGNTPKPGETARKRVERIENSLFEEFPYPNFVPYIQLHEFEALVLVDIDKILTAFPDGEVDRGIIALKASVGTTEPEMVNEHPDSAPSKRIISAIPLYKGVKSSASPEIVKEIGLVRIRKSCPNFNSWVTRLESLGESP